jgi:hypothetical protein
MVQEPTEWGIKWKCPKLLCSVACWEGSTSTPADFETRRARILAHERFDALWKSGRFDRSYLYGSLGAFLGLPKKQTHIGMFNKEQCKQVELFCEGFE